MLPLIFFQVIEQVQPGVGRVHRRGSEPRHRSPRDQLVRGEKPQWLRRPRNVSRRRAPLTRMHIQRAVPPRPREALHDQVSFYMI